MVWAAEQAVLGKGSLFGSQSLQVLPVLPELLEESVHQAWVISGCAPGLDRLAEH